MKESYKNKNKKVADFWGLAENTSIQNGKCFHWMESPMVQDRINKKISGDKDVDWVSYVINKYLCDMNNKTALSLGCGIGNLERDLQRRKIFKVMEAIDVSEGAISQAKKLVEDFGDMINYSIGDVNSIKLERNKYSVVFFCSSLHHVQNIEHVLDEVKKTLVSDGILIIYEYIGPSQFQLTNTQTSIINQVIDILPPIYRTSIKNQNQLKPYHVPSTKEYMNKVDPSEAIRSSEIVKILKKKFLIIERKDFGGTLLQFLLQDIAGNFNPGDIKDATVLKLLFYIEDSLINSGALSSDFTFMVLGKKQFGRLFIQKILLRISGIIKRINSLILK